MPQLIDLETSKLVPLGLLLKERIGRNISPATRWRWIHKGVRGGIKLEAVCVAGCWHTTREAFAEFLRAQTAAASPDAPTEDAGARSESTTRRLQAAGLL